MGSSEAAGSWVAAVWDLVNGLKITQLSDSQFLFRFVDESQAAKVFKGLEDCWVYNLLKVEGWAEHIRCEDSRLIGDCGGGFSASPGSPLVF